MGLRYAANAARLPEGAGAVDELGRNRSGTRLVRKSHVSRQ